MIRIEKTNKISRYGDIIQLPHHTSSKHPRMPMRNRAAQFSPFAALSGYEDTIKETERITDTEIGESEYRLSELNRQLNLIKENISEFPEVVITYFIPDSLKSGGQYKTLRGHVKKLDEYSGTLTMRDGAAILFKNILKLEII